MRAAVPTCRGPAPPAAPPGRWTPAPPPPAAAPCGDRMGVRRPRWDGGAGHRDQGRGGGGGGVYVTSPSPPPPHRPPPSSRAPRNRKRSQGAGTQGAGAVARRRGGGGPEGDRAAAGAAWGEVNPTRGGVGEARPGLGSRPAVGERGWSRRAGTEPGGGPGRHLPWARGPRGEGKPRPFGFGMAAGAALPSQRWHCPSPLCPAAAGVGGRCPAAEGERRGEGGEAFLLTGRFASAARQSPPRDGEVPCPGNDRRRLLRARVQGAPETQRPGEERGGRVEGWGSVVWCWRLISGGCWVPGPCQGFGTQHSLIFLLTSLASSHWHGVIQIQGTSGGLQSIPCSKQSQH